MYSHYGCYSLDSFLEGISLSSLFVIQGRDQGRKFELADDVLRLGRDSNNLLTVNDREVSRSHAEIKRIQDDQFEIRDLKSSNGTFVNNQPIETHQLVNGDRIRVGRTTLIFTSSPVVTDSNASDLVKIIQTPLPQSASRIVRSIEADGSGTIAKMRKSAGSEAAHRLDLVYQTAMAVSQTLDLDQLIDKLLQLIFDALQPDRGCILLLDDESKEMLPRISRTRDGFRSDDQLEISRSIVDFVVEKREGVITSDAVNDDRWDSQASILKMGVSEAICVPMQGRYGTQGVVYIDTRTPPGKLIDTQTGSRFNDEHLKLLIAIGHQAALAIEDTNFYSAMIQSERMAAMGQTIAMLSHHIKNILQGINGGSYLVKSGIASSEIDVIQSGWKIVEKNQTKISQLVMDMLSFSKDRKPEWIPGSINETVNDVIELIQHRVTENGITVRWQPDEELPTTQFDPEGIHRAVLNVVSNALDALTDVESPELCVTTRMNLQEQLIEIHVQDNAEGIPAESLEKIFGIFESGKGNRGTGLGLPVSRKIMVEHGGDIAVTSQTGKGSQFVLFFPHQPVEFGSNTIEIKNMMDLDSERMP